MEPLALVLSPITMGVRIYKAIVVGLAKHCMASMFRIGFELNSVLDHFVCLEGSSCNKVD